MSDRPRWRDRLAPLIPAFPAIVLLATTLLVARSFAPDAVEPGGSPAATAEPIGQVGSYDGPELTGVFVSCIPDCDLVAVSTGIGRRLTFTDRAVDESAPSLSPDGNRVAFRCAEPPVEPGPEVTPGHGSPGRLCILDIPADPEIQATTTTLLDDPAIDYGSPAWSPDGTRLAYHFHEANQMGIGLVDVESGETTVLTLGDAVTANPAWSPDGELLAIGCGTASLPSGGMASLLCTMPSEGGPVTEVGSVEGMCGAPGFGHDATYLGVTCVVPGAEGGDVFTVSLAEQVVRSLTGSQRIAPEGAARVAWSPDGAYAYVRSDNQLYAIALPDEVWSLPPLVEVHGDFDIRATP